MPKSNHSLFPVDLDIYRMVAGRVEFRVHLTDKEPIIRPVSREKCVTLACSAILFLACVFSEQLHIELRPGAPYRPGEEPQGQRPVLPD
jgi:hypothetical protein